MQCYLHLYVGNNRIGDNRAGRLGEEGTQAGSLALAKLFLRRFIAKLLDISLNLRLPPSLPPEPALRRCSAQPLTLEGTAAQLEVAAGAS